MRDEPLLAACGAGDPALFTVASALARAKLDGAAPPVDGELPLRVRDAGGTTPDPRSLVLSGASLDRGALVSRVRSFAASSGAARRCAVASVEDAEGRTAVAVVVAKDRARVEAFAPVVRVGQWVTVDATLRTEPTSVRVVVAGPSGAPRSIPVSRQGARVVARFAADRPGRWVAQVVADLDAEGPKPVAELGVRAGDGAAAEREIVPGDTATGSTDAAALAAMVTAAREEEGLPTLPRDAALDAIAQRHAAAMAKLGRVAHDVGAGDPADRVEEETEAREVGENVAHASSVRAAHHVLWASPSHRANLLSTRWTARGVGVARAADGSVFVAELFVRR